MEVKLERFGSVFGSVFSGSIGGLNHGRAT